MNIVQFIQNFCNLRWCSVIYDDLLSIFRSQKKTTTCYDYTTTQFMGMMILMERIIPGLDDIKIIFCALLNFTARFETVCRNVLFGKFEKYYVKYSKDT